MAVAVGCSALPPLFFSNTMNNYLAEQIGRFLENDKPSDQEVMDAAKLLLQCDPVRSRGIYNSAMVRPRSMLPWIRSDLKKFYDIYNKGLKTKNEVFLFNSETITVVRETLSRRPEDVKAEQIHDIPELGVRGKRADHDKLPESIRACWDRNTERWKKIRQLHAQLAQMIARPNYQSCDGNELCHTLREADRELRSDYRKYDTYVLTGSKKNTPKKDSVDEFTDNVKTVQNARTAITRALQRKNHTEDQLHALQQSVDTLLAMKQTITEKTITRLKEIGITVPNA
jgi:hypothetical protein